jgi:hypothetical protein
MDSFSKTIEVMLHCFQNADSLLLPTTKHLQLLRNSSQIGQDKKSGCFASVGHSEQLNYFPGCSYCDCIIIVPVDSRYTSPCGLDIAL